MTILVSERNTLWSNQLFFGGNNVVVAKFEWFYIFSEGVVYNILQKPLKTLSLPRYFDTVESCF